MAQRYFSPQWVSRALGFDVKDVKSTKIGRGQIANVYRLDLEYGDRTRKGPKSVALKTTSEDSDSRTLGTTGGLYEREAKFYQNIAPFLSTGPVATAFAAESNPETQDFAILMKDYSTGRQSCDIAGATLEQAKLCVTELGRLQGLANRLSSDKVSRMDKASWPPKMIMSQFWNTFRERYGDKLKSEHVEVGEKYIDSFDGWQEGQLSSTFPQGLSHGDYRLENMLLDMERDPPLTLVDWQTYHWGPITADLAFFLSTALTTDNRKAWQDELIQDYLHSLNLNMPNVTLDDCKHGIQYECFVGMRQAITASNIVERTDRGDELFQVMFERSAELAIETKATSILPPAEKLRHLNAKVEDEEIHPFTDKPMHNESWYFDVVDPVQEVGIWTRLGIVPNQAGSWYHTLICGPNIPTVGLIAFDAPHPGADLTVKTDKFIATLKAEEPLKKFRLTAEGQGVAFDDPAEAIGNPTGGRPVQVKMDLLYETDGLTYQWRQATRYELPCRITGSFSWDDKTIEFKQAVGQRDHSWGDRDWWAANWMWSAFHLDDGTRTHQTHIRIPNYPRLGVGYIQKGDELTECTDVLATETILENGLIGEATIKGAPLPLVLKIKPRGHAPLALVSPDGKVAGFPRAWAECEAEDGRKGVGWIEYNLNAQ